MPTSPHKRHLRPHEDPMIQALLADKSAQGQAPISVAEIRDQQAIEFAADAEAGKIIEAGYQKRKLQRQELKKTTKKRIKTEQAAQTGLLSLFSKRWEKRKQRQAEEARAQEEQIRMGMEANAADIRASAQSKAAHKKAVARAKFKMGVNADLTESDKAALAKDKKIKEDANNEKELEKAKIIADNKLIDRGAAAKSAFDQVIDLPKEVEQRQKQMLSEKAQLEKDLKDSSAELNKLESKKLGKEILAIYKSRDYIDEQLAALNERLQNAPESITATDQAKIETLRKNHTARINELQAISATTEGAQAIAEVVKAREIIAKTKKEITGKNNQLKAEHLAASVVNPKIDQTKFFNLLNKKLEKNDLTEQELAAELGVPVPVNYLAKVASGLDTSQKVVASLEEPIKSAKEKKEAAAELAEFIEVVNRALEKVGLNKSELEKVFNKTVEEYYHSLRQTSGLNHQEAIADAELNIKALKKPVKEHKKFTAELNDFNKTIDAALEKAGVEKSKLEQTLHKTAEAYYLSLRHDNDLTHKEALLLFKINIKKLKERTSTAYELYKKAVEAIKGTTHRLVGESKAKPAVKISVVEINDFNKVFTKFLADSKINEDVVIDLLNEPAEKYYTNLRQNKNYSHRQAMANLLTNLKALEGAVKTDKEWKYDLADVKKEVSAAIKKANIEKSLLADQLGMPIEAYYADLRSKSNLPHKQALADIIANIKSFKLSQQLAADHRKKLLADALQTPTVAPSSKIKKEIELSPFEETDYEVSGPKTKKIDPQPFEVAPLQPPAAPKEIDRDLSRLSDDDGGGIDTADAPIISKDVSEPAAAPEVAAVPLAEPIPIAAEPIRATPEPPAPTETLAPDKAATITPAVAEPPVKESAGPAATAEPGGESVPIAVPAAAPAETTEQKKADEERTKKLAEEKTARIAAMESRVNRVMEAEDEVARLAELRTQEIKRLAESAKAQKRKADHQQLEAAKTRGVKADRAAAAIIAKAKKEKLKKPADLEQIIELEAESASADELASEKLAKEARAYKEQESFARLIIKEYNINPKIDGGFLVGSVGRLTDKEWLNSTLEILVPKLLADNRPEVAARLYNLAEPASKEKIDVAAEDSGYYFADGQALLMELEQKTPSTELDKAEQIILDQSLAAFSEEEPTASEATLIAPEQITGSQAHQDYVRRALGNDDASYDKYLDFLAKEPATTTAVIAEEKAALPAEPEATLPTPPPVEPPLAPEDKEKFVKKQRRPTLPKDLGQESLLKKPIGLPWRERLKTANDQEEDKKNKAAADKRKKTEAAGLVTAETKAEDYRLVGIILKALDTNPKSIAALITKITHNDTKTNLLNTAINSLRQDNPELVWELASLYPESKDRLKMRKELIGTNADPAMQDYIEERKTLTTKEKEKTEQFKKELAANKQATQLTVAAEMQAKKEEQAAPKGPPPSPATAKDVTTEKKEAAKPPPIPLAAIPEMDPKHVTLLEHKEDKEDDEDIELLATKKQDSAAQQEIIKSKLPAKKGAWEKLVAAEYVKNVYSNANKEEARQNAVQAARLNKEITVDKSGKRFADAQIINNVYRTFTTAPIAVTYSELEHMHNLARRDNVLNKIIPPLLRNRGQEAIKLISLVSNQQIADQLNGAKDKLVEQYKIRVENRVAAALAVQKAHQEQSAIIKTATVEQELEKSRRSKQIRDKAAAAIKKIRAGAKLVSAEKTADHEPGPYTAPGSSPTEKAARVAQLKIDQPTPKDRTMARAAYRKELAKKYSLTKAENDKQLAQGIVKYALVANKDDLIRALNLFKSASKRDRVLLQVLHKIKDKRPDLFNFLSPSFNRKEVKVKTDTDLQQHILDRFKIWSSEKLMATLDLFKDNGWREDTVLRILPWLKISHSPVFDKIIKEFAPGTTGAKRREAILEFAGTNIDELSADDIFDVEDVSIAAKREATNRLRKAVKAAQQEMVKRRGAALWQSKQRKQKVLEKNQAFLNRAKELADRDLGKRFTEPMAALQTVSKQNLENKQLKLINDIKNKVFDYRGYKSKTKLIDFTGVLNDIKDQAERNNLLKFYILKYREQLPALALTLFKIIKDRDAKQAVAEDILELDQVYNQAGQWEGITTKAIEQDRQFQVDDKIYYAGEDLIFTTKPKKGAPVSKKFTVGDPVIFNNSEYIVVGRSDKGNLVIEPAIYQVPKVIRKKRLYKGLKDKTGELKSVRKRPTTVRGRRQIRIKDLNLVTSVVKPKITEVIEEVGETVSGEDE